MKIDIRLAQSDADINACGPVIRELRPHVPEDDFLALVRNQEHSGYCLAMASKTVEVVAVAGFRIGTNLAWGCFLYVDDLITAKAHRSCGYGNALLDWLRNYAREVGCTELHLDSGLQRTDAHRFYKNTGMKATGYHFAQRLALSDTARDT